MKRVFAFLSAVVGLGGGMYLVGTSQAQQPGGAAPPAAGLKAQPSITVFNMAAVMRDYGKAKYQVYLLNEKRKELSKDLVAWRGEYIKLQQLLQGTADPQAKDKIQKDLVELARKIEDKDREINKALNDTASNIISGLYDDIKLVVDKTAEMNGYHIVFAYPDAVTDEDKKNPYLKELKLKPPAAQPFFVHQYADITGLVVGTLNKWYPPVDAQGRPVDVNKLAPTDPVPAQGQGGTPAPVPTGVPTGVPGK